MTESFAWHRDYNVRYHDSRVTDVLPCDTIMHSMTRIATDELHEYHDNCAITPFDVLGTFLHALKVNKTKLMMHLLSLAVKFF